MAFEPFLSQISQMLVDGGQEGENGIYRQFVVHYDHVLSGGLCVLNTLMNDWRFSLNMKF
jgi:hypothetical protein